MATLIPTRSTCLPRMTPGERRFAHRIEDKLEDDYLVWYDVPVGPKQRRPDFTILHPRRGLLVLEVKDWKLETLHSLDKERAVIRGNFGEKTVANPLLQARMYALELITLLQRDPALVHKSGHAHAGALALPWGHGIVLTNITRAQYGTVITRKGPRNSRTGVTLTYEERSSLPTAGLLTRWPVRGHGVRGVCMVHNRKHVFISHHHRDDAAVDRLATLLKENGSDIRNSSIRAKPANEQRLKQGLISDRVLKRLLRRKISWASTVVVLIGAQTHSRPWVDWEIEQAYRQGKNIVGVFERGGLDAEAPANLEKYASSIVGWNAQRIVAAIDGREHNFEKSDGTPKAKGSHATSRC